MQVPDCARPLPSGWSDVPNPRSPAACAAGKALWVSDPAHLLPNQEQERLHRVLDRIYLETGSQCAHVALAGLHGSDCSRFRHFATNLFNHWGVGSAAHNNGVVIVLFQEDRRLEIVTGTGMSAVLPDNWLEDMQQRCMVPHFKAGDHAAGLLAGAVEIQSQLANCAPREWCSTSTGALEDPTAVPAPEFSGGKALVSQQFSGVARSHGRRSGSAQRAGGNSDSSSWLWGAGLAFLGSLILDSEEQRLEKQLDGLLRKPVFKDAAGAELAWPYAVDPAKMTGLRDVCSPGQGLRDEAHPFALVAQGLLEISCRAAGFGKRGLELTLVNPSSDSLAVEVPAGSLFVADRANHRTQPLVIQESETVILAPGEQRTLAFDVYCGDSGGSIPRCAMTLSQYVVEEQHLASQRALWLWSARFQQRSGSAAALPASEDFRTLQESFGILEEEARSMLEEVDAIAQRGAAAREQEVLRMRQQITEARQRREAAQARSSSGSGGSYSGGGGGFSGGSGFGGGRSSGGGAGCSW